MMASVSHLKLGILVLAGVVATTAIILALGLRRAPSVTYHVYFDESVQGLEVGALVKYRGVKIGRVGGLQIAPDGRYVAVDLSIERAKAKRLGLAKISPSVRAQLSILGITGLKIVDLDVVDPAKEPLPVLPFTPEQPYIASQPSLLTGVQRGLADTTDQFSDFFDKAIETLDLLKGVAAQIQNERIPQRLGVLADSTASAADRLERSLGAFDRVARRLDEVLARAGGPDGLVASAQRATDSFGRAGRITETTATELGRTMRDVGDAARAMRRFFKDLERQPDMLLKGRARSR